MFLAGRAPSELRIFWIFPEWVFSSGEKCREKLHRLSQHLYTLLYRRDFSFEINSKIYILFYYLFDSSKLKFEKSIYLLRLGILVKKKKVDSKLIAGNRSNCSEEAMR